MFTTNDVESASRDVRENVKFLANLIFQLFHKYSTLFIKDVDKVLQNFEMESRR